MATAPQIFSFTYKDLQEITGLTKAGVSQHVSRGNLQAYDLTSVVAFIARYGKPEIRLEIMEKMMGIDRQVLERGRRQSTVGVPREGGRLPADPAVKPKRARKPTR